MDRRRYLGLCVAGVSAFAGCGTDVRNAGTASQSGTDPPASRTTPDATPTSTPTPVPPLDGSWRGYQHDAANTGATDDPGPVREPVERWTHATAGGRPVAPPATTDGTFVVVTERGSLYARTATDGSVRWTRSERVDTDVAPVADDGVVVVAAETRLVGIDVVTGDTRWTAAVDGAVVGLAVTDGQVAVATRSQLRAVALDDGATAWRRSTAASVVTPPGAGAAVVAVGLDSGDVVGFDAQDGTQRWQFEVGVEPTFAPAVGHGNVYVGADSRLVALDAGDGTERWRRDTTDPVAASPVVTADSVVVATLDDDAGPAARTPASRGDGTPTPTATDTEWFGATVRALSPADGTERWVVEERATYNFTSGPPERLTLVPTGDLVVVDIGGRLRAYDRSTGARRWSSGGGDASLAATAGVISTGTRGIDRADGSLAWRFDSTDSVSPPVVAGNTVYVGSDDSSLYALAANTGEIQWSARTDGAVRAAPAVHDGTVYVGTMAGTLYAFDASDGAETWQVDVGGRVQSPTPVGETVYVGNFSPTLTAVDTTDGTEQWRTTVDETEGAGFVALETAATEEAVFTGANGDLRGFDAASGEELWRVTADERPAVQSPPAVSGGTVYVHMGGSLRALDAADGTEQWTVPTGDSNWPPAVSGEQVYTASDEGIYAFDASDGTSRWRTGVGDDMVLAVGDDTLYGVGLDTPLVAVDTQTGDVSWQRRTEATRPPALADEHLFVGGAGEVVAIGPESR